VRQVKKTMVKKICFGMTLALFVLVFPASARSQGGGQPGAREGTAAGGDGAVAKAASGDAKYVIGPQDVLDINVWKEAELSRVVPVRPDGRISLPLLNDVQAAGLTPGQLAAQITEGLKKFITNPQVTVIVTQINSQRVYILGETLRPGAYPLLPGMTVLQALSSGGGFTMFANTKKIYVVRQTGGKQEKFPFNYKEAVGGKHPEQNIVLQGGDQIVVP
jgi:polysaccharide biosynthesis/export protein